MKNEKNLMVVAVVFFTTLAAASSVYAFEVLSSKDQKGRKRICKEVVDMEALEFQFKEIIREAVPPSVKL